MSLDVRQSMVIQNKKPPLVIPTYCTSNTKYRNNNIEIDSYFILLLTLYGVSTLICIYFMVTIYSRSEKKLGSIRQNVEKIRFFTHQLYICS